MFDNDTNNTWHIRCFSEQKMNTMRMINCEKTWERSSIHRSSSRYCKTRVVSIKYRDNLWISILYKCDWMSGPQRFAQTLFSRFTQKSLFPHFLTMFIFLKCWCSFAYSGVKYVVTIWVTFRVSYKRQELLTLCEPLGSPRFVVRVAHPFSFLCCFVLFVFILYLVCTRLTASHDFPFLIAHSGFSSYYWTISGRPACQCPSNPLRKYNTKVLTS